MGHQRSNMSIRSALLVSALLCGLAIASADWLENDVQEAGMKSAAKCKDWDQTRQGMKILGLEGYAECDGQKGTKKCWNAWCEANCEDAAGNVHPACVLDKKDATAHTRCKCDDDLLNEMASAETENPPTQNVQEEQWSEDALPGKCSKTAPANKGDGCAVESDCGNSDPKKFFCIAAGDYTGRRRRKGGKCASNAPANAGKPCYGMESACGNTKPGVFYCHKE